MEDKTINKEEKPDQNKKPDHKGNIVRKLMLAAALVLIIASSVQLVSGYFERKRAQEEYERLAELARQTTAPTTEHETEVEVTEAVYVSPIDFEKLRAINPDVVGWVKVPGTSIDYPIVQTDNNETYLDTSFEGEKSVAGTVYLDCDSQSDFKGRHNIIYGHHMRDGSMFKDIVKFKEEDFFQEHRDVLLYFPDREVHLKTIAALYGDADGNKRRTQFNSQETFDQYVDEITRGCKFRELPGGEIGRLYSFVTCSYEFNNARTILYAVEAPEEQVEN